MCRLPLAAFAALGLALSAPAQDFPRLAPYPAARWGPEVQIDGGWYTLVSLDGVPAAELVDFARGRYGTSWQRRLDEDLVEVLAQMGRVPGKTVKLGLRDPATGAETTVERPMTGDNWAKLKDPAPTRDDLRLALKFFAAALDQRWAYRKANAADFPAAVAALGKRVDVGIAPNDFGIELQKIVSLGLDGHAGVEGFALPGGCLPFLVEPVGERFCAVKPDRSGPPAAGQPYLTKLDGKPLSEWLAAAAVMEPQGSPQFRTQHALRTLRHLDFVRGLLKLPAEPTVDAEFAAADGTLTAATLKLAEAPPAYGVWPRGGSRLLPNNVGYLRLATMDKAPLTAEIRAWMPKFKDTAGLIVDVRDNGGGDRDALALLHSYLADPAAPPRVVSAAAYRLHPARRPGHLTPRALFPADAAEWSPPEHTAIAAFAKGFQPQWTPPAGEFSGWHYQVLGGRPDPAAFRYAKPVAVLMNAKCFSATDVFLAGLKGAPGVTLVGAASGGGSAYAERLGLGRTPFTVRLGTMASFQTDGGLFDGRGVAPDVTIEAGPEYHAGGADAQLAEALRRVGR